MKLQPKFLNNLPRGYQLARGDRSKIASYRANQERKQRAENKPKNELLSVEEKRLNMLAGNDTAYAKLQKFAKSIIAKKGKRWACEFAMRISRLISRYPTTSKRRQKLAELAVLIRTYCKIN